MFDDDEIDEQLEQIEAGLRHLAATDTEAFWSAIAQIEMLNIREGLTLVN